MVLSQDGQGQQPELPIGGSIAIPSTYVRLAKQRGAVVRTKAGVKKVLVRDGAVYGVVLEDGSKLETDVVVSTSSLRSTVRYLVGVEHFPGAYVDRIEGLRASHIAVQAKIALDKKLVHAGALVGGVGDSTDLLRMGAADMKQMYGHVEAGRVPDVIPFYMPVPTNFDPSLAPPGCQLLTVCALAPRGDVPLEDPAKAWEEAMLRAVRRVVPGMDEHVMFIDRFSVQWIEHWIGKEFGPAISTGQIPGQVGKQRPPTHTPIKGLYVAGCGAGARGVGTELAAASAMECVDRLLTDMGRPTLPVPKKRRRDRYSRLAARAAVAPLGWALAP